MGKSRLEAFSDGVIAILITILVLELKVPHSPDPHELLALAPVFAGYVLSFVFIAIYWSNHHHLLHTVHHVSGGIMWANSHLLFWLSLIPFTTGWMGEYPLTPWPVALYGVVLLMSGIAYALLTRCIVETHGGGEAELATAIGRDLKGKLSPVAYFLAIVFAFIAPVVSIAIYVLVALVWLVPDRRIERAIGH